MVFNSRDLLVGDASDSPSTVLFLRKSLRFMLLLFLGAVCLEADWLK